MATPINLHGMDIYFAANATGTGTFPNGYCANGETPVVAVNYPSGPAVFYTKHRISPSETADKLRGGCVFDPANPKVQGLDNRTTQTYSTSDHQVYPPSPVIGDDEPPFTQVMGPLPGQCMVMWYYRGRVITNAPGDKAARRGLGIAIIIVVNAPTVPANMLRPCLFHQAIKPITTTSVINFAALPIHTIPAGAVEPDWDAEKDRMKYPVIDWGTNGAGVLAQNFEYISPTATQDAFMAYSGFAMQTVALGALSNSASRQLLIIRLCEFAQDIQWHVDYRDANGNPSDLYFARGGHGSGRAGVRFLASYWLSKPAMRLRPPAILYDGRLVPFFTDDGICRIGPPRLTPDEYGNTYPDGWPYYGEDHGPGTNAAIGGKSYEAWTANHMVRDYDGEREPWWADSLHAKIQSVTGDVIKIEKWFKPSQSSVVPAFIPIASQIGYDSSDSTPPNMALRHGYFLDPLTDTGVQNHPRTVQGTFYNSGTKELTVKNANQILNGVGGLPFVRTPAAGSVMEWSVGGLYLLDSNPARMLTCLNIVLAGKVADWNFGWGTDSAHPADSEGAMFFYAARWIDENAEIAPKSRFIWNYVNYNVTGKLWADANSNWASKFYETYAAVIWPQPGPGPYVQKRVNFNGTTYFTKIANTTGLVDGPQGTLSLWFDIANPDGAHASIVNLATCVQLLRGSDNKLRVLLYNSANLIVWDSKTTALHRIADGLTHIALAWNLTGPTPVAHMAVNGVLLTTVAGRTDAVAPTAGNVNYGQSTTLMGFGAVPSGGAYGYSGQLGDLYFDTTFLDLSVATNLKKLIDAGQPVRPVSFGKIYFGDDMVAADWNLNNGKGSITGWTRTGAVT
jgi:hypothetical protein